MKYGIITEWPPCLDNIWDSHQMTPFLVWKISNRMTPSFDLLSEQPTIPPSPTPPLHLCPVTCGWKKLEWGNSTAKPWDLIVFWVRDPTIRAKKRSYKSKQNLLTTTLTSIQLSLAHFDLTISTWNIIACNIFVVVCTIIYHIIETMPQTALFCFGFFCSYRIFQCFIMIH